MAIDFSGLAGWASAYLDQEVEVRIEGSGLETVTKTMKKREADNYRYETETVWWNEGYRRRYRNTRYKGKPIDQNLFTRGKKHEEWRRFYVVYQDGRIA